MASAHIPLAEWYEAHRCLLCKVGFPLDGGFHHGTQRLGMIPRTVCGSIRAPMKPTCAEAEHGDHEACEHIWEWLGQAAQDRDALSELAHERAHNIERLEQEKTKLLGALEYVRQVTAGERSDDFSDDEEPIIAMNLRAREAMAACVVEN